MLPAIAGYVDLIRDNRLINFGPEGFSAIEKVVIKNADGVQYDAYMIAICGSDDFEESYKNFVDTITGEYYKF